jgi:hypothetical protein
MAACEGCNGDPEYPWWYQTNMIGLSVTLPLDEPSIQNLGAMDDIDPALVVEILEAHKDWSVGIFKEISSLHPKRNLCDVVLCRDCLQDQCFGAWVEELCQIWEIVYALERRIDLDKQRYEMRCMALRATPQSFYKLRFCDLPWPVRGSEKITSPGQLSKSEVRRFLFSRCILRKYLFQGRQNYPREVLTHYKRFWNPKRLRRLFPWYSRAFPSSLTEQKEILKGVALVRRYLDELEEEDWKVILGDNPSQAQKTYSSIYRLKRPNKAPESVGHLRLAALGVCLATEAALLIGIMQRFRPV